MAFTHNERLALRRVWPNQDWPQELEEEHARRSKLNFRFMGFGKALNSQQMYDLILLFVDENGEPMRGPRPVGQEGSVAPQFTGTMSVPHFDSKAALANDAEHTVQPEGKPKSKVGSKLLQEASA